MSSRSWITGLALAGVAGSAGAAFAGISEGAGPFASASELPSTTATIDATTTSTPATARTISYQVGTAGTVTLTVADGSLAVTGSSAGTGWTVVGAGAPGTHVEVQFTDTMQVVTFSADLVGDDVVVALASVPTVDTTVPMDVTVIATPGGTTPAPQPATPATPPPSSSAHPTATSPTAPTISAPSSGGDDDDHDDDDHADDDHEDGDHGDDHEDGDHDDDHGDEGDDD